MSSTTPTPSKPDDGGPAFPSEQGETGDGRWNQSYDPGMSLRDYFAGKAMPAIFAGEGAQQMANRDGRYDETNWSQVVALNAYEMADAMIAARKNAQASDESGR